MHSALYSDKSGNFGPKEFFSNGRKNLKNKVNFMLYFSLQKKFYLHNFFHFHPTILHFMSHYLQSTISSRKISNQRRTKIAIFSTVILKPNYDYLCNFVLYQKCLFGLLHRVLQFIRKYADKGPFCTT